MALIEPGPQQHPFFLEQCPNRGAGLTHIQHGTFMDPCSECGLRYNDVAPDPTTKERLDALVRDYTMREAGILPTIRRVDQVPAPPIMERKAARGTYGEAPLRQHARHGRGKLTPEWEAWALLHTWGES